MAMFGVDVFEAWEELQIGGEDDESEDLASELSMLQRVLVTNAQRSRTRAAIYYNQLVQEKVYSEDNRVLL